jgi:hypothetical protein
MTDVEVPMNGSKLLTCCERIARLVEEEETLAARYGEVTKAKLDLISEVESMTSMRYDEFVAGMRALVTPRDRVAGTVHGAHSGSRIP